MKKAIATLLKFIAYPFLAVGVLLVVTGAVIKNGWPKTEEKLDKFNEFLDKEMKK